MKIFRLFLVIWVLMLFLVNCGFVVETGRNGTFTFKSWLGFNIGTFIGFPMGLLSVVGKLVTLVIDLIHKDKNLTCTQKWLDKLASLINEKSCVYDGYMRWLVAFNS